MQCVTLWKHRCSCPFLAQSGIKSGHCVKGQGKRSGWSWCVSLRRWFAVIDTRSLRALISACSTLIPLPPCKDPKKVSSGSSFHTPARSGHRIPYLVVIVPFHARWYPIYCVTSCSGHTAAAHRKTPLCLFRVHDSLPENPESDKNRIMEKPLFDNLMELLYAWLLFQYVKFIFVKVTFSTE